MTVKEMITMLQRELTEDEMNLPIYMPDAEWGNCRVSGVHIEYMGRPRKQNEVVVLETDE